MIELCEAKCTIARDWTDRKGCGKIAVYRNRFGGFECQEHFNAYKRFLDANPDYIPQPDSFFNQGVIIPTTNGDTLFGKFYLMIAYFIYRIGNSK
jgi:hypothetical protein